MHNRVEKYFVSFCRLTHSGVNIHTKQAGYENTHKSTLPQQNSIYNLEIYKRI